MPFHAVNKEQRGTALNDLGVSLVALGERESGNGSLLEAIETYSAALEERPRSLSPLDWAMTQMNLAIALLTLGEREPGTAELRRQSQPTARR